MDFKKIIQLIIIMALFGLSAYSFSHENGMLAILCIIVAGFFVFSFMRASSSPKKLDKMVLIKLIKNFMEEELNMSIDDGSGIRYLYDKELDPNWKFIFFRKDKGLTLYYPAVIDKYTGQVGEKTGVVWNAYETAYQWLTEDKAVTNLSEERMSGLLRDLESRITSKFKGGNEDAGERTNGTGEEESY